VSQFLKRMHKHYEVVVFTASLSKYADPLVDIIDPDRICSYKLFREHCTYMNNAYVKDLTRLGRLMTDIIIVDNSPVAYML
jgi:RNA polymerase II subunit A small phosphatase-like protein